MVVLEIAGCAGREGSQCCIVLPVGLQQRKVRRLY